VPARQNQGACPGVGLGRLDGEALAAPPERGCRPHLDGAGNPGQGVQGPAAGLADAWLGGHQKGDRFG